MGAAIVRGDGYTAHSIWEHSESVARLYRQRARDEAEEMTCAAQAAELLQVSVKTLHRWSREDPSMPVLRRGRVVRFPRERFVAWLKRQEQGAVKKTA